MARFPGAVWYGNCRNNSGQRTAATRGLVLHVNDGPNVSLWNWVNSPSSNMSCHFQVLQNGVVEQYLDTDLWSWCQADGNNAWLSMEMPTVPSVGMTAAQIATGARILTWASKLYGFPLQITSDPDNGRGLGWHGMGGDAWGGHSGCPGDIRRGQMAELLAAAKGGTTAEDEMSYSQWPAADKAALTADITKAILDRGMGGYNYDGSLGDVWIATLRQANNNATALNDPAHGVVVALARLEAAVGQLLTPAELQTMLSQQAGSSQVDAAAIADALVGRLRDLLDAAPAGSHAATGSRA